MKVSAIVPYVISPILLGMHWVTQHPAWLYLFGALSVVVIVVCGLGAVALVIAHVERDYEATSIMPAFPKWKYAVGGVYQVASSAYLLWVEAWLAVTLYLIGAVITWLVIGLAHELRKQKAAAWERRRRLDEKWMGVLDATDIG